MSRAIPGALVLSLAVVAAVVASVIGGAGPPGSARVAAVSGAAAPAPAVGAAPAPSAPARNPGDLMALVREAQRVQRRDAAAWARFRFRRDVLSQKLAEDGAVLESTSLEFEITPSGGDGFDERLVRIDGREPTAREVEEHRGAARFTRHYRTLAAGQDEQDAESGYSLATLLRLSTYTYAGLEEVDGVQAHRLDFEPDPEAGGGSIAARITQAMSGSLWISVDGLHLVKATATTRRPVMLFLGLSRVRSIEIGLETEGVAPGIFLPRIVTMVTNARVFFATVHRRQTFTYSDFTRP